MQSELLTLRGKMDDITKENTRLQMIIDTICIALKKRGLVISIEGEMINIEEGGKSTTTTRIRGQIHNSEQGE